MSGPQPTRLSYLRKVFYFNHLAGLAVGGLFPLVAAVILGPQILQPALFLLSLAAGFGIGAASFFFVRQTLKNQLRQQLELLRPLAGENGFGARGSVEAMDEAVTLSVRHVERVVRELVDMVDRMLPGYREFRETGSFLFDRAQDGLSAAQRTRGDITSMVEKQREIRERTETFSFRTQEEAALSRELSASLEEMASALETSTEQFLETTSTVDEMASSMEEVATQSDQIARGVEGTTADLDAIGEALGKIGEGAAAVAGATAGVRRDAEQGLSVVENSIAEMERVEGESRRTREAMERLAQRTGEVTRILGVIRELVSDTELLAFNAAIIAAQAGDEGRGFAVVAEEIRELADRTANSAGEIQQIVERIGEDTGEVNTAVATTGERIGRGRELILSTGKALRLIVDSSRQTAADSEEISGLTQREGKRARTLLQQAGESLGSVRAIARAMQEQRVGVKRIQEGVNQMKAAGDQISRGMEEQVRANREFDRSLAEREDQLASIAEAVRFQLETSERVFTHFASSEERLKKNAEILTEMNGKIEAMEETSGSLREAALALVGGRGGTAAGA